MRDPYSVLGVSKAADEKEIKSAFRKLAKKLHPDQNPDDPRAKDRFSEINHAYEILGDKEKRGQFDRGEIDAEGKPKFAGFEGFDPRQGFSAGAGARRSRQAHGSPFGAQGFGNQGFGGADDILNELFGSAFNQARAGGGARGAGNTRQVDLDLKANAKVSVEDLARGKGNVHLPDGRQLSFSLPEDARDGQVVRLSGQGRKHPGMKPGDALVTLSLVAHPKFQVSGHDLRTEAPLPLYVAVKGGKVTVETLDGRIALNVPAWTSSGKIFRLKGKGLPKKGGGHGDLLVSVGIVLPDEDRAGLEAMVKTLQDTTTSQS
ncbi:MAG: DnaJ C-terminal domain-containing protein [Nitratireductor sp.]